MANPTRLDPSIPIVSQSGLMQQAFNLFMVSVANLFILSGSGSPEGVVEAVQLRLYMDTSGTAGNILYIKRDADDGAGDKSKGWILV